MQSTSDADGRVDGRHRRSRASRRKIVQALLELISEGEVLPGAEAVATRAGVGLRTVFRHFENMESLYRELIAAMETELRPIVEESYASRDWRGRLAELMDRRVRIFERMLPFKVAADIHRSRSPALASQGRAVLRQQRSVLARIVPDSIRRDRLLFEALDLLLSVDSWQRLRRDQQLTPAEARATLDRAVNGLLGGVPPSVQD
ncbi:MAG TPA: TetR/AcrR family transcriptional regulator [Gammaproteobacteria bacterium]|nr:TetR/AcrR family transcriptional regulator [Gammaproteobacteria bacterium]